MTLSEFHAWLEGYSASFKGGSPNPEQWTQIVNRLANVEHPIKIEYAPSDPMRTGRTAPVIVGPYYSPTVLPSAPDWQNPVVTC